MRGVGPIDERGRLALVGSGLLGAGLGFSVVLVFLVDAGGDPSVLTSIGLAAALAGAAVGVVVRLWGWQTDGGYSTVAAVTRWLGDRHVPGDVPAAEWVPKLELEAQRRESAIARAIGSAFIIGLQLFRLPLGHGTGHVVSLVLIIAIWGGSGVWQLLVVLPRARTAASMLANGVHDREASPEGDPGE
ncbi:hypothetical protein [Curtobacterium sp. RRHDQ10]|uniref:hypothetical protein n=1 Tax=Curtobacterium phyllosphaerae TaxID=3413379 RepID=UPI003BF091DB